MIEWLKAMNTGLSQHYLKKLRPEVIALWYQFGSGFAWTRDQVDACLAEHGPDLRPPVLTTPWQRQRSLPALADAFPRGDWEACKRAMKEEMAAEAAASEQQAGPEPTQPPPVSGQTGTAPAAAGRPAKKEEEEGLAQNAPAGNMGDLPTVAPRPSMELPAWAMPRSTPRLTLDQIIDRMGPTPAYVPPSDSSYMPPSARPRTSHLTPVDQQPNSLPDKVAAEDMVVADVEALQYELYTEELAKMEDSDEWSTEDESMTSPKSLALVESLQREADWERLEEEFLHRVSSGIGTSAHGARSYRLGRGNRSPRRGQDDRSRSPRR